MRKVAREYLGKNVTGGGIASAIASARALQWKQACSAQGLARKPVRQEYGAQGMLGSDMGEVVETCRL